MPTYTAEQFIQAIDGTGGIVSKIAERVGCAWNTAKTYIESHPTVKQAWVNECNRINDMAKSNLIAAVEGRDLQISKWWVQCRDPEFAQNSNVNLSGEVNVNLFSLSEILSELRGKKTDDE